MKAALKSVLAGDTASVKRGTLKALERRGMLEPTGELTAQGWRNAVASLKLPDQCQSMGIELQTIGGMNFGREPERAAWHHYKEQGYEGAFCEGSAILLLIRAAALDFLEELNPFGSREDACKRYTEAQLKIHEGHIPAIANTIENADLTSVMNGFREIYRYSLVQKACPGLSESAISALFSALGAKGLREIAVAIANDPYLYRAGWPDLTLARGSEMLWIEVKTTDKLHMSQITTLTKMRPLLPGNLLIVKLTNP